MRIKIIFIALLVLTIFAFPSMAFAAEIPPNSVSLSEAIYADLALRNDLDHVGLYYFDGDINNTVAINAEKTWDPASTIKLYVAMYAFDQISLGKLDFNQIVTVDPQNVAPGVTFETGYATLLNAGDRVTIYELLDRMITQSGNTSYNTLLDVLDRREVTKYIHDLGLTNSSVGAKLNLDDDQLQKDVAVQGYGPNVNNADDFARAFILIKGKRIPGSVGLFDMLSRQKLNEMLPARLPKNVLVAHKTGELDPFYHDGGMIIGPDKNYILTVFTDAGNPDLVAHLSELIYTNNINLVGQAVPQKISEEGSPPLDPLVANGEIQSNVLAAVTQNVKTPLVTASDLGINPTDLSYILTPDQLPKVIIPADSRFHFLVEWGDKITSFLPATPALSVVGETSKLRLKLAEATDLLGKNKVDQALTILSSVNDRVGSIAQEKVVSTDGGLQKLIENVSTTRFSILNSELPKTSQSSRTALIKEVARQAQNTLANVKPFVVQATKARDLSQAPLVGNVISTTPNTVTIKIVDGSNVTVPVDMQVKVKSVDQANIQTLNISQISKGSQIALLGASEDKKIKPFFVLTNVPVELYDPQPVRVVKVNTLLDTMIVVGSNGVPIQVNLNKNTIIKGDDTNVALNELNPGDIVAVHGIPVSPPSVSHPTLSPSPKASLAPAGPAGTPIPVSTILPGGLTPSATPVASLVPSGTNSPISSPVPPGKPAVGPKQQATQPPQISRPPQVIKGKVIEVIEKASNTKAAKPKPQNHTPLPTPR